MRFNRAHLTLALTCCVLTSCGTLNEAMGPFGSEPAQGPSASSDGDGSGSSATHVDAAVAAEGDSPELSLRNTLPPDPYWEQATEVNSSLRREYDAGLAALDRKDWRQADSIFAGLSINRPELSGPYLNRGIAQEALEQTEEAERSYASAIEANSANQEAYNRLALLQRKQGRFQEAEQTYQQAIGVWAGHANIRRNLGILYELYLGQFSDALAQYEVYQQLLPEPDRRVKGWIIDLQRRIAGGVR